ncbi:unnamed protein product [Penicillium nalgiovense]|uniref:Deacetylase complex subunit Sds3 n=1 Tax=Penicillium nalgiovense TaxID=60175 RepID=A0A1V6Y852_PENNA|nr:hypothetical protein PENNAL_c0031G10725 [Penicillium nalgiovense]CAG7945382.1 unnamed protein product [Penicillium nalgiovense]CAG7970653.1 unnamed protein product [Penicillium nalgiovense]CAG7972522.1 unnamed protein product [Penicillium nalgiovense]CAG7979793.1 unnamed protein product [Penicillium nalgiovense]
MPSTTLSRPSSPHTMSYPNPPPLSPGGGAGAPSKRDKRRTALQERLQELTGQFSNNRDIQFRQQLHALQCDMTLINNADPYGTGPLPDSAESIAALIEETVGGGSKFAKEMAGLAGSWYSKFVQEVNEIKEKRDAELVTAMNNYNNVMERQQRDRDFRTYFAQEEFRNLSSTLRERLVQNISGKRARLMREKEQLDIADTNALLLHPNQFSITNPSSPGGIHSNRKTTRHTRHRVDLDELGNGFMSELNKRKRKAPEEDNGSPARDAGDATPAKRNKAEVTKEQVAPSYSIHSLFTDKELNAHANQAHLATIHFFSTSRRPDHGSGAVTNGNNTDAEDTPEGTGHEDNGTPSAADMMRTASHNFHATRSTRTTAAHSALSALADLADKPATRPILPYHVLSNHHARPNGNAPPLTSLMNEEVDDDCARISRLASKPQNWIDASLVELVAAPLPTSAETIDGHPADPAVFSQLHPDFSPAMGIDWTPTAHNPGFEMFQPAAMERERSRKRTRNH